MSVTIGLDAIGRGLALGLLAQGDSFWLPPRASSTAAPIDAIFHLILNISIFFFLLIVALLVLFVVLYRRRPGFQPKEAPTHSTILEVTWTSIPVVLVAMIFYTSFTTYMDMKRSPGNAYDIRVHAQKWNWNFEYPDGTITDKLHVPVDRPVRLTMDSRDVIHSFYVPAFRNKMDVVPGRYTTTWFRAVEPGEFDLVCAEYCGTGHSDMLSKVIVHPPGEFEQWLEKAAQELNTLSPPQRGERLFRTRGCSQCHSTDGTPKVGPSLKGVYGHAVRFSNAPPIDAADDNYIRESVLDPMAKIVDGFQGQMPTYQGRLKDHEITDLIEYLKSLK